MHVKGDFVVICSAWNLLVTHLLFIMSLHNSTGVRGLFAQHCSVAGTREYIYEGSREEEKEAVDIPVVLHGLLPVNLFLASGIKRSLEQREID